MSVKSTGDLGHGNVFSTPNAKEGLVCLPSMTRAAGFFKACGSNFRLAGFATKEDTWLRSQ